ncbi:hypothetical protein PCANB_000480 [Pneumocystis canis]|nr:hypothetical protein PCANB_000480 [Pneumocystis canis]
MEKNINIEIFKKLINEAENSKDDTTFNFSHKKITTIPEEIIDIIKDKVFRNLSFFPDEIKKLSRLRYLNIRANIFKEFPIILCDLPSLEILDISRNKIRSLPHEFGNLMSLKVLSISRNKLKTLPLYIAKMNNLKILKIDHNPITFPPKEITYFKGGEKEMLPWLDNIKSFLSSHKQYSIQDNKEQDLISEKNSSAIQHHTLVNEKTSISPSFPEKTLQTSSKDNQERKDEHLFLFSLPTKKTLNNSGNKSHQKSIEEMKSQINNYSSAKISHNHEIINNLEDNDITFKFPKNSMQINPDTYFKRFSALPETKRAFLKSIKVIETSRGILFSLSQVYQGIRQYIVFCTDPSIKGTINLFLYTANIHIEALAGALEGHETKDPGLEPSVIISECCTCIEAFKQVIGIFHKHIKKITMKIDIRYTRTLLLLLYGAAVEIQNSWMLLAQTLPSGSFNINSSSPKNQSSSNSISPHHSTFKSLSNISGTNSSISIINASNTNPNIIPTMSNLNQEELPNIHTSSIITQYLKLADISKTNTDEHLFEKILTATTVTLSVLTLLENAITQNTTTLSKKDYSTIGINSEIAEKLKELTIMSIDAKDVAQRLRNQLKNIRENNNLNYKQKFWEDTNAFVKSVIAIAALAKLVSTEFPFSKPILSGLSTVTRSTKELTILLSISSFRFMAESQTATVRLKSFSSKPQTAISSISTSSVASTKPEMSPKTEHSSSYLSSLTPIIDSSPKYAEKTNLSVTQALKSM